MAGTALRKHSITALGEHFRTKLASQPNGFGPGAEYRNDLIQFLSTFTKLTHTEYNFLGQVFREPHTYDSKKEVEAHGIKYINVGIICGYKNPNPLALGGHAVAYIKINNHWYTADNEKGFLLIRKRGPPVWETKYATDWNMQEMHYFYVSNLVPLFLETNLNNYGFHGKLSFKQSHSSCWSDSIQSIIMNANGYRHQFMRLYNLVKQDKPLNQASVDITIANCNKSISRILGVPDAIDHPMSHNYKCIMLLSLSFVRMMTWEPPFVTHAFVTHIQGQRGIHELEPNDTTGAYNAIELTKVGTRDKEMHLDAPSVNTLGGYRIVSNKNSTRRSKQRTRTYK